MPTLPAVEEPPTLPERAAQAAQRVGAAIGADVRVVVYFVAATFGVAYGEEAWAEVIGFLGLIGLALDRARRR